MSMKPFTAVSSCLAFAAALVLADSVDAQTRNVARDLAATCATCHGTGGNSVGNVPPSLAGRPRAELVQMMMDFKTGKRPATVMHRQARGYTDEQIRLLSEYLSSLKPEPARIPSRP
jgi:cytochrome subunit of sulfide dehydrogenase